MLSFLSGLLIVMIFPIVITSNVEYRHFLGSTFSFEVTITQLRMSVCIFANAGVKWYALLDILRT